MNRRELESRLQDLLEGRLEDQRLEELQEELRSNPDARDSYREYVHLQNGLQLRGEGIDLLHVVPMDRVVARRGVASVAGVETEVSLCISVQPHLPN